MPRESGASSTPRLIGSINDVSGILDRLLSRAMTAGGSTNRHCERSEAIHSFFARRNGLLRCARNDGAKYESAFSRRDAPELLKNHPPI
jgi:hypothetical protein